MATFKHNEAETVRVPKLNDMDTRLTAVETSGGGGAILEIDGGDAYSSGAPDITLDGGDA